MADQPAIPLLVKLLYTAFTAVLVPYYWTTYGAWNFLFFCDVALLMTLAAVWTESPLLASIPTVGITLPQLLWVFDFVTRGKVVGMASYMFDPKLPLFVRALSSFHGWLPFLLLGMVWRLGYDRRALAAQVAITWAVLLICYFLAPAPPAPAENPNLAVNINYVFGPGYERPQTWMPPLAWLALLMVGMPALLYLPTDLALRRLIPPPALAAGTGTGEISRGVPLPPVAPPQDASESAP